MPSVNFWHGLAQSKSKTTRGHLSNSKAIFCPENSEQQAKEKLRTTCLDALRLGISEQIFAEHRLLNTARGRVQPRAFAHHIPRSKMQGIKPIRDRWDTVDQFVVRGYEPRSVVEPRWQLI